MSTFPTYPCELHYHHAYTHGVHFTLESKMEDLMAFLNQQAQTGFYITGEFVHSSNRMSIVSLLQQAGLHQRRNMCASVGLVVHSSLTPYATLTVDLDQYKTPIVANEAAMCKMLGIAFKGRPQIKAPFNLRGRGTTSQLAMGAVLTAWQDPGKVVRIEDHFGTKKADHLCMDMARAMVAKLGFRGFTFDYGNCTVVYHDYRNL